MMSAIMKVLIVMSDRMISFCSHELMIVKSKGAKEFEG